MASKGYGGYKQAIDCKICKKRVMTSVWKMHVMGKKHMHYTPAKITVSGTFDSNRVGEVHNHFSQFGTIGTKKVTEHDGKVAIDYIFQDKRAHSIIIYKEHYLFSQELKITWDQVTTPLPHPSNLALNLKNQRNNAGVNKPAGGRKLSFKKTDSESSRQAILQSVKEAQTFTDQVLLLQTKLQIDKLENEKKKKLIQDDLTAALLPMFALNKIYFFGSSVTGLDVRGSDLDVYIANVREEHRPEVQTLKIVRHLIYKCRKFCDVLLISGAKIPIIKCIHTKTQICCDLNIKNKLSVCNSQLIRYYLSLDEKLRPLMIMIKFWADLYDLKKVNFFSSYALYMMVIFYLQQEPYNIPAVKDLQRDIAPNLVEGWNCAFELRGFANSALKNESLMNLVRGFFSFYSKFDYTSKVISPFLGIGIDKTCFVKPCRLPGCYQHYVNHKEFLVVNSGVCIQDPFEHARNVAASVPLQCIGRFVHMCRTSLKLMDDGESDLHNILTQKTRTEYKIEIQKPDDKDEEEWTKHVEDLVHKILSEIMNMKIVQTRTVAPISYICRSDHDVFDGRINILRNLTLPNDTNDIDKEIAATKSIVKYLHQNLIVGFSLEIDFKQNPCRVDITLSPLNKKCKNFLHACHFFYVRLEKYLAPKKQEDAWDMEFDTSAKASVATSEPSLDVMTQKNDKSDKNKVGSASAGKQVSGGDETIENRTDGGGTSKSGEEKPSFEDEEEDVPADFFDDFSNQDFMDGLDIVDAWDEDKLVDSEDGDSERSAEKKRKAHSPIRFVSKSSERPNRKYIRSRSKSINRRYAKRSNSNVKKRSRSRSRDRNRMSDRRDPEKTKRDIHKDKIKVAKDREQKLVNDKLRIVETGLVPPGMEMEADINTILRKEKDRHRSDTGSSVEKIREPKLSRERDRERERERERRYLRRSGSRELRKLVHYSPSPPPTYRNRPRERELPYRPRKRTSSMDSNLSERELWIRSTRKRTRSRSRSRDSLLRRAKMKKYEEKKKKTFLEEIRDKLNETRTPLPPTAYGMQSYPGAGPHSIAAPTPAPVPAPPQYFPPNPNPQMQQYDQSFFIGDAYQGVSQSGLVMGQPQPMRYGNTANVMQMHQVSHVQTPTPVATPQATVPPAPVIKPQALVSPKINILSDGAVRQKVAEPKKEPPNSTEDIDKLFADKKISLSDFLTITAKCEDQTSSPEHLQKKIKVISRCQDAVKAMSDDRKFNGRLSVRPSFEQRSKADSKYQSPLRRIPIVRFQFTSPMKMSEEMDGFAVALDKILQKIGVLKETIDLEGTTETISNLSNSSFADEETAALTLKASLLNTKKIEARSECEECKRRKMKSFAEVGSQCVDNNDTVSIATQVTDEDLTPAKALPKNDSIAYLTPAQLLGKEKEKEVEVVAPATPEKTAEKKVQSPASVPSLMKPKPKPPTFKTRGAFRKTLRDRAVNNYFEYDNEEFYDVGQPMYEDPRENFGRRFGGPPRPPGRFPRQQYMEGEEMLPHRLHQFVEEEGNFTDFAQPFRGGRGGRFPRY